MVELNGIANIKILMDNLVATVPYKDETLVEAAAIYQQLDLMERYMVAIGKYIQHGDLKDVRLPYWHEIRENKEMFELNNKKVAKP